MRPRSLSADVRWRRPRGLITLAGLPPTTRLLAAVGLLTTAIAGTLVVLVGWGVAIPGGTIEVPRQGQMPVLIALAGWSGLAVAAGIVGYSSSLPGWPWPRVTRVAIAIVGGAVGAALVDSGASIHILSLQVPGESVQISGRVAEAAGWLGWAGALGLLLASLMGRALRPAVTAMLAAAPFAFAAAAFIFADTTAWPIASLAVTFPEWAGLTTISAREIAAAGLVPIVRFAALAAAVLLWWDVLAFVRSGRAVGHRVGRLLRAVPWLLVILLAVKVAWIAVGFAGALPDVLAAERASWSASAARGPGPWLTGGLLVGLAVLVLWRARFAVLSGRVMSASWLLIGAFASGPVILALAYLTMYAVTAIWPGAPKWWISSGLSDAAVAAILPATLLPVLVAPVAAVLLWRRQHRTVALVLVAFSVWGLTRGAWIAWVVLTGGDPAAVAIPTGVDLVTLDVWVTVAVGIAAAAGAAGVIRVSAAYLVVVLVVSTWIAHAGTLLPGGWNSTLFYAAFVFAPAWQFLFDSRGLNKVRSDRPALVLGGIARAAGLLVIVLIGVALGDVAPDRPTQAELAQLLLTVPLGFAFLAASLGRSLPERASRALPVAAAVVDDGADVTGPHETVEATVARRKLWREPSGSPVLALLHRPIDPGIVAVRGGGRWGRFVNRLSDARAALMILAVIVVVGGALEVRNLDATRALAAQASPSATGASASPSVSAPVSGSQPTPAPSVPNSVQPSAVITPGSASPSALPTAASSAAGVAKRGLCRFAAAFQGWPAALTAVTTSMSQGDVNALSKAVEVLRGIHAEMVGALSETDWPVGRDASRAFEVAIGHYADALTDVLAARDQAALDKASGELTMSLGELEQAVDGLKPVLTPANVKGC